MVPDFAGDAAPYCRSVGGGEIDRESATRSKPVEGGDAGGIGDAVSAALPGFGLVAGIGALALAAVGASRFTREE